jgi:hypothetical protein
MLPSPPSVPFSREQARGGSSRANSRSPLHPSPTEWEKGWGVRAACRHRKGGNGSVGVSVHDLSAGKDRCRSFRVVLFSRRDYE